MPAGCQPPLGKDVTQITNAGLSPHAVQSGEPVELGLRDLAVGDCAREMPAHVAEDLHGAPEILARVGLGRLGRRPGLDVVGLQQLERGLQRLAAQQRPPESKNAARRPAAQRDESHFAK